MMATKKIQQKIKKSTTVKKTIVKKPRNKTITKSKRTLRKTSSNSGKSTPANKIARCRTKNAANVKRASVVSKKSKNRTPTRKRAPPMKITKKEQRQIDDYERQLAEIEEYYEVWSRMSDGDKQPYRRMETDDKRRYVRDVMQYSMDRREMRIAAENRLKEEIAEIEKEQLIGRLIKASKNREC